MNRNNFFLGNRRKKWLSLLTAMLTVLTAQSQTYHDAALFNAPFGHIEHILYQNGVVNFKENGQLDKDKSTYLSFYNLYKIERDAKGYPVKLTTDYDVTTLEYDNNHRIARRTIKVNGGGTTIKEYIYQEDKEVTEVTVSFEGGQPKRVETKYDDVRFDAWNNWVRKGLKGTTINETNVEYVQIGLVVDGYLSPSFNTTSKTIGATNESRNIYYRSQDDFTCGRTTNDVSVLEALSDPFFIGVGQQHVGDFLNTLKTHKDLGEEKKGYSGHRWIVKEETGHTCCGLPLKYYTAEFFKGNKWTMVHYSFLITTRDARQTHQLFNYLASNLAGQGCSVQLFLDRESVTVTYGEDKKKLRLFKLPKGLLVDWDNGTKYPNDFFYEILLQD